MFPVAVVFGELLVAPREQRRAEEELSELPVAHLLEAAVAGFDASGDDPELAAAHLLAEHKVFSEKSFLVEAAQLVEDRPVEHHEHPGAERGANEAGAALVEVDRMVSQPRAPIGARTENVGGHAMQAPRSHLLHAALDQGLVTDFDVRVHEQDIARRRDLCAKVPPEGRQTTLDDMEVEEVQARSQ